VIKIDVDELLDLLIPFEGSVHELRIQENGRVKLMKTDGTNQIIPLKKIQKKKVKQQKNHNKGWTSSSYKSRSGTGVGDTASYSFSNKSLYH